METKINLIEILKDKPLNFKLYDAVSNMKPKSLQTEAYCISNIYCGRYNVMMIKIADLNTT